MAREKREKKKISVKIPEVFKFLNKKNIKNIIDTAFLQANIERYDINIIFMNEEEMAHINHQLRNKNKPTNVISINYNEGIEELIGEIFICQEVVVREAIEQEKTLLFHITHLLVHSALHLVGFDHQSEQEQSKMEALEKDILKILGCPEDPYREL